jgi:hypothetical protein
MISYFVLGALVALFVLLCFTYYRLGKEDNFEKLWRECEVAYLKLRAENADLQRQLAREVAKKLGAIK